MRFPFFSVIMATHKRPQLLRRSLGSLRTQTWQDFETIVVSDVHDADSAALAAQLLRGQDRYLTRNGRPGPALSRNAGLEMARGDWVVFLDDDDSFESHHLATLAETAQRTSAASLFTDCAVITEDRTQAGMPPLSRMQLTLGAQDLSQLWIKNFIPNHALAYRRTLLADIRFDAYMASLEDWDFLLAVCSQKMPQYFSGGGVVMHKDYVNPGQRRGQQEAATNSIVIQDFLYAYRRWPAPTQELKAQRQALIAGVGLPLPIEWF